MLSLLLLACTRQKDEIIAETGAATGDSQEDEDEDDEDDEDDSSEDDCSEDPDIGPDMEEVCNGIDDNCDGQIDEGVTRDFYEDADEDGHGDPAGTESACDAPSGYVTDASDCDDARADVSPTAAEVCDDVDNDCDGAIDEDASATTWYADSDGDGAGDPTASRSACDAPAGYVADATDCNDADARVHACQSCQEVLDFGMGTADGVYSLDPCGTGATDYWCDLTTDGGGWTLAGWQDASGTTTLGISDWGVVGDTAWSVDLACLPYDELMVFNVTDADWHAESYTPSTWSETAVNIAIGDAGLAFKHGTYGPSDSQIMMACVDYSFGGSLENQYACDTDGGGGARGHLADYAGEFCGARLDYTWAWSDGATCTSRGVSYTWGFGLRGYGESGGNED